MKLIDLRGRETVRILDYGCDDGSFTFKFSSENHELYGIEINKEQSAKAFLKGIKIINDLGQSKFDLIIFRGTLQHIPEALTLLQTVINSHMNPKSYIVLLANPNSDSLTWNIFKKHPAVENSADFNSIYEIFSAKELRCFFESRGFKVKLYYPYFKTPYRNIGSDFKLFIKSIRYKSYEKYAFPRNMFNLIAKSR